MVQGQVSAVGHAHIPASLVVEDTHSSLYHEAAFRKATRWPSVASGDRGTFLGEVMPMLVFRAWGAWARRKLRLKRCGIARVALVSGGEGGSWEIQPIHLPQLIPSCRTWTTFDCYGWQRVGLHGVLLYFG